MKKIFQLESSSGKQDKCVREKKGFNGYGFGQSLTKFNCYPSYDAVKTEVNTWINKRKAEGMNDAQLMCYYNLGKPNGVLLNDCEYYQNSLKVK